MVADEVMAAARILRECTRCHNTGWLFSYGLGEDGWDGTPDEIHYRCPNCHKCRMIAHRLESSVLGVERASYSMGDAQ